ncbi:LysM peptidoglycan-binding domain-containing protein [Marinigracilibium pacificum]|uniref:LysM peptidoglycan-binding domain-containing protein n=1 Tax=Marinigracilibium pacificum TaxID=2729599 RepID=A0A848J156_9BACT|nr:LysM peptidoglycan-binding domain-containing protein [Marinigracilibium pacificum]NMM49546.1 LysM peptidoglycan-binding domain-containing protein [Marinigracilibium pacificum]
MKIFFSFLFTTILFFSLSAQSPEVPEVIHFADLKLKLSHKLRKEIQADVDNLTRYPKYFNKKVDRAIMYFPLIERAFSEEKIPLEFKYLVLQESALIGDAVSSSNAVGYWQFKDFTGLEVGLQIDRRIDERMHIVAASHGAAKYLKNNNAFFDNWLYALQAYQMGRGGAEKVIDKRNYGVKKMNLDHNLYWYVKKFLAHMVAFEYGLQQRQQTNNKVLVEYYDGQGKDLKTIARKLDINEEELLEYNKWLRKGNVPTDKNIALIVPVPADQAKYYIKGERLSVPKPSVITASNIPKTKRRLDPVVGIVPARITINGREAIIAESGDTYDWLAVHAALPVEDLLKYNDLESKPVISNGQVFYVERKKNKANVHYHTMKGGETLWSVSQKYGIKLKSLIRLNRLDGEDDINVKTGLILWLRDRRPKDEPYKYKQTEEIVPDTQPKKILANNNVDQNILANQTKVQETVAVNVNTKVIDEDDFDAEENNYPSISSSSGENSVGNIVGDTSIIKNTKVNQKSEKVDGGQILEFEGNNNGSKIEVFTINEATNERVDSVMVEEDTYENASSPITKKESSEIEEEVVVAKELLDHQELIAPDSLKPTVVVNEAGLDVISYGGKTKDSGNSNEQNEGSSITPDNFELIESTKNDESKASGITSVSENRKDSETIHKVVKGDTYYSISKKYDISVSELLRENSLTIGSVLSIDQELKIPQIGGQNDSGVIEAKAYNIQKEESQKSTSSNGYKVYVVRKGDSLYKIARENGVTIQQVMDWNNKKDFDLSEGEELKIKEGK